MMSLIKNLNFNKQNLYTYKGSLTTPPCSEIVTWLVVNQPQAISREQVAAINSLYRNNTRFAGGKGNNRAVQPLNERLIYMRGTFEIERMDPQFYSTLTSLANGLLKVGSALALSMILAF
jgi:hypothetical protein